MLQLWFSNLLLKEPFEDDWGPTTQINICNMKKKAQKCQNASQRPPFLTRCNSEESEFRFRWDECSNDSDSHLLFPTTFLLFHILTFIFSNHQLPTLPWIIFWKEERQITWDLEVARIWSSFLYAWPASCPALFPGSCEGGLRVSERKERVLKRG